jgi:hypothetical protein
MTPTCRPPKRITVRAATYRGVEGFAIRYLVKDPAVVIDGKTYAPPVERGGPIFAKTREGAEAIRAALRRCDQEAVSRILLEGR